MRSRVVIATMIGSMILGSVGSGVFASESQTVIFNADGTTTLYDNQSGEVVNTGEIDLDVINKPEEELRKNANVTDLSESSKEEGSEKSDNESNPEETKSEESSSETKEPETEAFKPGELGKYKVLEALNIRKEPNADSERVGLLGGGDVVEVLDASQKFYKIDQGYVSSDYLEKIEETETETETEAVTEAETETETETETKTETETEEALNFEYTSFADLVKNKTIKKAKGKEFKEKVDMYQDELDNSEFSYRNKGIFVTLNTYETEDSNVYIGHVILRKPWKRIKKQRDIEGVLCVSMGYSDVNVDPGWVMTNGEIIRDNLANGRELCFSEDGTFYNPEVGASIHDQESLLDTWSTSDATLIVDGKKTEFEDKLISYPRTIIGMVEPGEYYVIGVEVGQSADTYLSEIQNVLKKKLKCNFARSIEGAALRIYVNGTQVNGSKGDRGNLSSDQDYIVIG